MRYVFIAYLVTCTILSGVAFIAYGLDKRRARLGSRRISEAALHRFAWLGGWPGALLGKRYFHHKTQKASFVWTLRGIVIVHLLLLSLLAYAGYSGVIGL